MWFLYPLIGGLATAAGSIVGRALLALGISYVTFKGMDISLTAIFDSLKSNMAGLPAETLNFLGFLWLDKAISMIFAAYTAALAIKMAGKTSITKMITKSPV